MLDYVGDTIVRLGKEAMPIASIVWFSCYSSYYMLYTQRSIDHPKYFDKERPNSIEFEGNLEDAVRVINDKIFEMLRELKTAGLDGVRHLFVQFGDEACRLGDIEELEAKIDYKTKAECTLIKASCSPSLLKYNGTLEDALKKVNQIRMKGFKICMGTDEP